MTVPPSRRSVALQGPPLVLLGFPRWRLRPSRHLYRAHTSGYAPWWFASDRGGRFNLPAPHGTCYLATDARTALRERFGHALVAQGVVSENAAATTVVSRLRVPSGHWLADTCSEKAEDFGQTREIGTIDQYDIPRQWAIAFHVDGYGGIRYQTRFTTSPAPNAVALFADAGEQPWPLDPAPTDGHTACRDAGLTIARRPTRRRLRIVTPPS